MRILQRTAPAIVTAALLAAAVAAGAGCAGHSGAAAASLPSPIPVSAVPVRVGTLSSMFTLTGTIVAARQANLSSVISAPIRTVAVQIGDRVTAGQLLVKIDDSTLQAQLAQDEASLVEARARLRQTTANDQGAALTTNSGLQSAHVAYDTAASNWRRNEDLYRQGYISSSALDDARSQLAAAQASLQSAQVAAQNASMTSAGGSAAQADVSSMEAAVAQGAAVVATVQTQIDQTSVTAPFDGIVTARNVDPGTLASPGAPLVQVSQLDPAYVNVGIPDGDLRYVRAGSEARVQVDALPGRSWTGIIENLNDAAGQGTLTYLARVAIPNRDLALKAGMVSNVTFVSGRDAHALIVPRGAIFSTDSGSGVYVVEHGVAKLRIVTVGLQTQTDAQVEGAGIEAGTVVITQRPDALTDGSPVKVVSSS
jgi:HlyD family secretion protein